MCGAHIMPYSWDVIYRQLQGFLDSLENRRLNLPANYNVRPSMTTTVVVLNENVPEITLSRWGLIPVWWKSEKLPTKTFNARCESIEEQLNGKRGMWGRPVKSKRCLVLSGGYFEWTGPKVDRRPHYIHLPGREMHAFAGLWETTDAHGLTHTVITAPAASKIEHLHHRMPIILKPENYEKWLSAGTAPQDAMNGLNDNRAGELVAYEVSKQVNSGANDESNLDPVDLIS